MLKKKQIELLDCTLRDGGIVIDFNFGIQRMQQIKQTLECAGINYIECGYINEKKGKSIDSTCFDNELSIKHSLLNSGKKKGINYVAIIDHNTFNLNNLHTIEPNGIDGIRYAFHKEDMRPALKQAKIILDKGYDLYIQPMVSARYSNQEFKEMIDICNTELYKAKAFYIVDSFGQMDNTMVRQQLEIADNNILDSMSIGFHGHNNKQMVQSNALTFVLQPTSHNLMIDSTIMGMGKGAGNLCTELIIPILNQLGNNYQVLDIYNIIGNYISKLKVSHPWGYSLDNYLASVYGCTPSYIKIFNKDKRVTTNILISLLENMPECKRAACDKDFAQQYLKDFFKDSDL